MSKDNGKWLFPGIALAVIATLAIIAFAAQSNETPRPGECQYANNFVDSAGQTWSVIDIQVENGGCTEAIEVALERGKESVGLNVSGLQPAYEARGWNCNSNSVCTKDETKVTFALALEE